MSLVFLSISHKIISIFIDSLQLVTFHTRTRFMFVFCFFCKSELLKASREVFFSLALVFFAFL